MNFTYENQGTNTYLVYTVSEEDTIDSMTLGMLTNNKIPGLAATLFTQMDATKYIKYNVSAHIPVSQFFAGAVNKKRLLGVFKGIVEAILSAEDYMIEEDSILLDLDYIFADVSTCETVLICLPIECQTKHDLGAFFKGIMFRTQFDQTENCDYVAKIINHLNSTPLFSLNDFKELLTKIEASNGTVAPVVQPAQPQVTQSVQPQVTQPVQTQAKVENKPPVQAQAQVQQAAAPAQKQENLQFGANYNPAAGTAPAAKGPAVPPVATQQSTDGKNKSFSLFGSIFSKEKKENTQQSVSQPAKQPAKPVANMGFDVPGQPAKKTAFEVPGQQTAIPQAKAQPAAPSKQQTAPSKQQTAPQAAQQSAPQVAQQAAPQVTYPAQSNTPLNFGETVVLSAAMGETTVLSSETAPLKVEPHLIRVKNNEKIPLNKPVFRIGKERSYVDYFIGDNTAVSRSHANIINKNGEFFVVDTNSTNHTYVNGAMSPAGVETKLSHGDKLRFANEEFEFRMQ